ALPLHAAVRLDAAARMVRAAQWARGRRLAEPGGAELHGARRPHRLRFRPGCRGVSHRLQPVQSAPCRVRGGAVAQRDPAQHSAEADMGTLSAGRAAMARRAFATALCLALAGPAHAAEPLEYAVKAAYLAKFPFYVDWPPAVFPAPGSPLNLCVVGEDPFGSVLDEAVAGQQVQGHAVTIRRLKGSARDANCHIAYLGTDARLENWRNGTVLVVTDGANAPGMINFVLK